MVFRLNICNLSNPSQVPPELYGFNRTVACVHKSLERLGVEVLDLVLLHDSECSDGDLCPGISCMVMTSDRFDLTLVHPIDMLQESWNALVWLQSTGAIRGIGVSNFAPENLTVLKGPKPAVVQNWCDPFHQVGL